MKTNKVIKSIIKFSAKNFNKDKLNDILFDANNFYDYLCKKYYSDPKALKKQTLNNMFPIVAVYKAMLLNNIDKDLAFKILKDFKANESLKSAKITSKLLSIFGIYKQYPKIFKNVTLKSFSNDAGFDPQFVVANKKQCKFDMKRCAFCQRLKEEDCFELVPVFCNTDIVFNTHLHKNIIWKRQSTLAEGADCCDFDVSIKDKND